MAASTYESALQIAQSLSNDDKLRLIRDLSVPAMQPHSSILEICGLGADLWRQTDAQEYVNKERASWAG